MTSQYKEVYWNKKAEQLVELLEDILYGNYNRAQMMILRELANIIYPAGSDNRRWRKEGFLIGSHPHYIFEKLEDAFFEGEVHTTVNKLLHDYERYELLAVLVKMK